MGLRFVALSLLLRLVLASTNPRYLQSIAPPTKARYVRWLATKQRAVASRGEAVLRKLREDVEPVAGTDASICWLGDRTKAAKFVLFFHGGGYIAPATKGHFEWAWNSYVDAGPGEKQEVAVAIVQYTLCPPGRYPLQLTQCCAALDMLLMRGIAPADLLFGGDSAGGNLTVQVLRHLVEPHPGIEPTYMPGPVAGVFMVSPLVDGRVDARSYDDNNAVDMICKPLALQTGDEMFQQKAGGMSVAEMRALALPMEGDAAWMKEANSVAKAMYITAGKQECFVDDILAFTELLRRECPGLDLHVEVAEHEAHDYILLEGILGTGFDATSRMKNWARQHL